MNKLQDIKDKYQLNTTDIAYILGKKSPANVYLYYDKDIAELTVNQLIRLHDKTNVDYNTLLGETIFTPNNIDNIESNINILDNKNEYLRETIRNTTQEVLAENEDIKSTIIKQVILLFKDEKYKNEIKQFIINNINTSNKDLKR